MYIIAVVTCNENRTFFLESAQLIWADFQGCLFTKISIKFIKIFATRSIKLFNFRDKADWVALSSAQDITAVHCSKRLTFLEHF